MEQFTFHIIIMLFYTLRGQGQSMERVGVFIGSRIFARGQLYIALSRAKTAAGLKLYMTGGSGAVQNIVYPEIL